MSDGLHIRKDAELDFLSLGALVHRLDPGIIPFRKATECKIHVSGGEFNVAANLSDCFGLRTAIATAMSDYPIGDLIAERVRAMGVKPFYKHFKHDGVRGPNMAAVYSDRGYGVRAPVVFYNRCNEAAAQLKPGDFDWKAIFAGGVRWVHQRRHLCGSFADHGAAGRGDDEGSQGRGRSHFVRSEFSREAVEDFRRQRARRGDHRQDRGERGCAGGQRRGSAEGTGRSWAGGGGKIEARSQRLLRHDRQPW